MENLSPIFLESKKRDIGDPIARAYPGDYGPMEVLTCTGRLAAMMPKQSETYGETFLKFDNDPYYHGYAS